jgi:hypothetical protein
MSDARQPAPADIVKRELRQFLSLAERTGMDADRLRHSLGLSPDDWESWLGILRDAPLPSYPALPRLLRHLGSWTSRLDRMADGACA